MKKSIPIIFGLLMAVSSPAFSESEIDCEFIKERATEGLQAQKDMTSVIKRKQGVNVQLYIDVRQSWVDTINSLSNAYIAFCK